MATAEAAPTPARKAIDGQYEILVRVDGGWEDTGIRVSAKNVKAAVTEAFKGEGNADKLTGKEVWPVRTQDRTTYKPKLKVQDPIVEF